MRMTIRWLVVVVALGVCLWACARRDRDRSGDVMHQPVAAPTAPMAPRSATPAYVPRTPTPTASAAPTVGVKPVPKIIPQLDHEPLLRVLLARAPRVSIVILAGTTLQAEGWSAPVPAGTITIEGLAGGWRIVGDSRLGIGTGRLSNGAGGAKVGFRLDAIPAFGETKNMSLAGSLLITSKAGEVQICEEIPMERYLASVVAAEMNPTWPAHALAAQAIVARSYASARWMERYQENWHIHWHFGVDMAYHGASVYADRTAPAIASTKGEVLMFRGFPVLALFNASSGGRTEAFSVIKPKVMAPDGQTPIADAMPVVNDAAAIPGAAGLKLSATHANWKMDMTLPEVTAALQKWSKASAGRPSFGTVEAVSIGERSTDSGRVATVSIRHRDNGATRFVTMAGTDFRMAIGPGKVRSTLWDRCVVAAKAPGYLVIEGRGFGHGCGLSQVSAWYLAKQGSTPEQIVARFYAGAKIERRY